MRILDESGNELLDPDLTFGYLEEDKLFIRHHEAKPEISSIEVLDYEEPLQVFPTKGKLVNTKVIQEYQPAEEAWDEYEDIYRYISYSQEKIDEIKAEIETAEKETEEHIKKQEEHEAFLNEAPERLEDTEEANLDQDELIIALNDELANSQLDTDEALTAMYELIVGGTNE